MTYKYWTCPDCGREDHVATSPQDHTCFPIKFGPRATQTLKDKENPVKDLKPVGVKAPLALLPLGPLGAAAGVMEHGATKYAPWNWMDKSMSQARMEELLNAALRHTLAINDPSQDEFDEESGIHHAAHAVASLIIYLYKRGITYQPSKLVNPDIETFHFNTELVDNDTVTVSPTSENP